MEFQNLSVEQIQDQLNQIEQNKVDLENALSLRWNTAKSELAQEIRDLIEGRGYDLEEMVSLLQPRKRRGAGGKREIVVMSGMSIRKTQPISTSVASCRVG